MVEKLKGFALYKKPGEKLCHLIGQTNDDLEEVLEYEKLGTKSGFVFAPFTPSKLHPVVVIRPDIQKSFDPDCLSNELEGIVLREINLETGESHSISTQSSTQSLRLPSTLSFTQAEYRKTFGTYISALNQKRFDKLVLARTEFKDCEYKSIESLFTTACKLYPNLFVALVSTSKSGTWLITTPEILLKKLPSETRIKSNSVAEEYSTMALAGTKPEREEPWSEKNIREQKYVADYIQKNLEKYSENISVSGPRTVQAGSIYHLRTDFKFTLREESCLGNLIEALHPTPAVCGLPKEEASRFIQKNEHIDRKYYSGFFGPFRLATPATSMTPVTSMTPATPESSVIDTSLFVALRCAEILEISPKINKYCLYAGGGLVIGSEVEKEWLETKAKMSTILKVIS